LSVLISGSDQRILQLQEQLQASQIHLSTVKNQLAAAEKNQARTDLHLALTQQLLGDSQQIAREARIEVEFYQGARRTNLLCPQALNIIHDTLDPSSASFDPASPNFITYAQQFSSGVMSRTPADYFYVHDMRDDYHTANTAYAKELRELRTEIHALRTRIARALL